MNLALHCKRMVGEIRRDMVRTGGDMQTAAANQTGLTRLFLAPPARLELTTFRLGGGPSIPVRYGGILCYAILRARSSRGKKLCILFNILLHGRKNVNPGGKEKQTKIPEKTLLK